jgi:prephenate dehydrogenase
MSQDMVLVNRKEIRAIIEEIEDRLDELEILTEPEFMKEVKKRAEDVEKGVEGLGEEEILDMLK